MILIVIILITVIIVLITAATSTPPPLSWSLQKEAWVHEGGRSLAVMSCKWQNVFFAHRHIG